MRELMNTPLVSVILPIYNVEQVLKRCLDSVCNQTYLNLEIILVDDGSTDNSGNICDEYAKVDKRIKVIHKKNGGLSDARNVGLDIANGDYLTLVDSDDFISAYYVQNLMFAIQKSGCELSSSWFCKFSNGIKIGSPTIANDSSIEICNREDYYKKMLLQDGVEVSAWGKMYKSSLFNGVRYPFGKLYEDIPTTYLLIEKVEKIAVIPNVDYYYYQRKQSISKSSFNVRKMDAIVHMGKFMDFIVLHYPNLKNAAISRYFSVVCNILFLINDKKYKEQKKFLWSEVKKYRSVVLFDKGARKKNRMAALISYFGYGTMRRVYKIQK